MNTSCRPRSRFSQVHRLVAFSARQKDLGGLTAALRTQRSGAGVTQRSSAGRTVRLRSPSPAGHHGSRRRPRARDPALELAGASLCRPARRGQGSRRVDGVATGTLPAAVGQLVLQAALAGAAGRIMRHPCGAGPAGLSRQQVHHHRRAPVHHHRAGGPALPALAKRDMPCHTSRRWTSPTKISGRCSSCTTRAG